jgi:hypothetical protein
MCARPFASSSPLRRRDGRSIRAVALTLLLAFGASCKSGVEPGNEAPTSVTTGAEAGPAADAVNPTPPATPAEARELRRYLALEVSGQRVGGFDVAVTVQPDGARDERSSTEFSIVRESSGMVDKFQILTEETAAFASDGAFVRSKSITTEAGVKTTKSLAIEGNELVFEFDGPGRKSTTRHPLPEDFRSSLQMYLALLKRAEKEGYPVEAKYSVFDTTREAFETHVMTLEATLEVPRVANPDGTVPGAAAEGSQAASSASANVKAWRIRELDGEGQTTRVVVDEDYMPVELDLYGVFKARWVAESPLGKSYAAKISSEIEVVGAVDRWWELAKLDLKVTVPGDDPDAPALFDTNLYHDVKRTGTDYEITLKHSKPDESVAKLALPLDVPEDVKRYLGPTSSAQSDDPKIIAKAKEIVGNEANALLAAERIVGWVNGNLDKRSGARGAATATEVLTDGAGDCTEHSVLAVALLRAAGLPARQVDGIVYLVEADGRPVAGYHAWSEVWLGRWIAIDAMFGETGTSARYLMFGYDEPGAHSGSGRLGRTIGRIKIEVVGHERLPTG